MIMNQKVTGRISSVPAGIAIGEGVSMILTVIGALVTAMLVDRGVIPEERIGYGSLLTLLAASVAGAIVSWKRIRHRRMMVCMIHSAGYYLLLLSIAALFFGGQYEGMGVTALVVLAGGLCVAMMGLKGERKGNLKISKMMSR